MTTTTEPLDLARLVAELRGLREKATEGPWVAGGEPSELQRRYLGDQAPVCDIQVPIGEGMWRGLTPVCLSPADAALIVEAVNSLEDLLSELAQLREQLYEARNWIAAEGHAAGCSGAFPPHRCKCRLDETLAEFDAALSRSTQGAPKEDEDG